MKLHIKKLIKAPIIQMGACAMLPGQTNCMSRNKIGLSNWYF